MIFPLDEIRIHAIFDAGRPNHERVVFKPVQPVSLQDYCLIAGPLSDAGIIPSIEHFYKFPALPVGPNYWLILYTGSGVDYDSMLEGTNDPIRVMYWHQPQTVLLPGWTVALVRIGAMQIRPL